VQLDCHAESPLPAANVSLLNVKLGGRSVQVSIARQVSKLKRLDQADLDFRILQIPMPSTIEVISVKKDFGIANALSRLETWKSDTWSGLQNQHRRTGEVLRLIILLKTGGFSNDFF